MNKGRNKILLIIILILVVFLIINICYLSFSSKNDVNQNSTTRKKISKTSLTYQTFTTATTISQYQKMLNALSIIPSNNTKMFTLLLDKNMVDNYFNENFSDLKFSSNNMNIKLSCFSFVNDFCNSYIVNIDNVFYFQENTPIDGANQSFSIYKSKDYYVLRTNDIYKSEYRIYSKEGLFLKYYLDLNVNDNSDFVINDDVIYMVTIDDKLYDSYNCNNSENKFNYLVKKIDLNDGLKEEIASSFDAVGVAGC